MFPTNLAVPGIPADLWHPGVLSRRGLPACLALLAPRGLLIGPGRPGGRADPGGPVLHPFRAHPVGVLQ